MRRLLPLLALVLIAGGCSRRDRSNPFDPHNPQTGGGPSGFVALAGNGRVDLRWDPVLSSGLSGYRLYRKTAAETAYRVLTTLSPSVTRYADLGLLNGLDHAYRLVFVFSPEGERGPPAEDVATPGRVRPWIADAGTGHFDGGADLLTADGRHVASRTGLFGPSSIGVDSVSGVVWLSESDYGQVVILHPAGGAPARVLQGFVTPSALAVDPRSASAWVCDERGGRLFQFDETGSPLGNPIESLRTPLGVAIDPIDRSVWVAERDADRLLHFATDHSLIGAFAMVKPSRVAVDSVTRRVWVTSLLAKVVRRVAPSGALEDTVALLGPIGVAVDPLRGTIWIADTGGNRLVALDRTGATRFTVGGVSQARDVAVDRATGEAWAVAPGTREVVRVSPTGAVLRRLGGFSQPLGVAVDAGR